jgi:hypothetical protein
MLWRKVCAFPTRAVSAERSARCIATPADGWSASSLGAMLCAAFSNAKAGHECREPKYLREPRMRGVHRPR